MDTIAEQWRKMKANWHLWEWPLRPNTSDVDAFATKVEGSKVLLLGETPELLHLSSHQVDMYPSLVKTHRANWLDLSIYKDGAFDTVIGDGCLNVVGRSHEVFFKEMRRVLKPGGKLIMRVFLRDQMPSGLEHFLSLKERPVNYSLFKLQAMTSSGETYVKVNDINQKLKDVWDHPTLTVYAGSEQEYYFPSPKEITASEHAQSFDYSSKDSYEKGVLLPIVTWVFP